MNGEVICAEGVSSTLTTNKGEGIKVVGYLDMKGTQQIRRVYEDGGGESYSDDDAGWTPRTEDNSKDFP